MEPGRVARIVGKPRLERGDFAGLQSVDRRIQGYTLQHGTVRRQDLAGQIRNPPHHLGGIADLDRQHPGRLVPGGDDRRRSDGRFQTWLEGRSPGARLQIDRNAEPVVELNGRRPEADHFGAPHIPRRQDTADHQRQKNPADEHGSAAAGARHRRQIRAGRHGVRGWRRGLGLRFRRGAGLCRRIGRGGGGLRLRRCRRPLRICRNSQVFGGGRLMPDMAAVGAANPPALGADCRRVDDESGGTRRAGNDHPGSSSTVLWDSTAYRMPFGRRARNAACRRIRQ